MAGEVSCTPQGSASATALLGGWVKRPLALSFCWLLLWVSVKTAIMLNSETTAIRNSRVPCPTLRRLHLPSLHLQSRPCDVYSLVGRGFGQRKPRVLRARLGWASRDKIVRSLRGSNPSRCSFREDCCQRSQDIWQSTEHRCILAELPLEHPAKLRHSDPLRRRLLLSLQGAPAHSNSREHEDSMSGHAKTASSRHAADADWAQSRELVSRTGEV